MADNNEIIWDGTPISEDEIERNGLTLQRINENGTVEEMIQTINANFRNIAIHGGGPAGIDGLDGTDGVDGVNAEYIYALCDSITEADRGVKFPDLAGMRDLFNRVSLNGSASYRGNVEWFDHPQGVDINHKNEYVDYYNNHRPAAALQYKSPVQFKLDQGF